jgi:hypothetical protein
MDRTKEHLFAGDFSTIRARLNFLAADAVHARVAGARRRLAALAQGLGRGASMTVPDDVHWFDGVRESITVPPLTM